MEHLVTHVSMSFMHIVPTPGVSVRLWVILVDMGSVMWSRKNMVVSGPYMFGVSSSDGSFRGPGLIFTKTMAIAMKRHGKMICRNESQLLLVKTSSKKRYLCGQNGQSCCSLVAISLFTRRTTKP